MRVLFIGDIIGKPGRRAVRLLLPKLREQYHPDVLLANGENLAGGIGITRETAQEMLDLGISVLTTGNHVWDQREAIDYLEQERRVIRPLNYPPEAPGSGWAEVETDGGHLTIVNLQGRVFMPSLDNPFRSIDEFLGDRSEASAVLVDFHAEATGEKQAMGFFLDGRVGAVIGTHTHVATADARLLPKGTAYISDIGMVGGLNSAVGADPEIVIKRSLTQMPQRFQVARGPVIFSSVLIDLDEQSGLAQSIELLQEIVSE